jgi:hypothetical protein
VNFADYFDIVEDDIIYDEKRITEICNTIDTVYPTPLKGRLHDLISGTLPITYIKGGRWKYFGGVFELPSSEREEQLIVYARCGGGKGYVLFKHLRFSSEIKKECMRRYDQLEKPYIAFHIRNTDRECDYAALYRANQEKIKSFKEIYIATDDRGALEFFRDEGVEVKNFTEFPAIKYGSLHLATVNPHTKMMDLLCDLYITAMSSKLLSNSKGGFINLIRTCHANRAAVEEQFRI